MEDLHPLVRRQLRKCGLENLSKDPSPEDLEKFLLRVSSTYATTDQDRYTYERALDVSSREMRELNARISQQKEELARSLESLEEGVVYLDDTWKILFLNQGAARLIGCGDADLIGHDAFDALRFYDAHGAPITWKARVLAGRTYSSDEHFVVRNHGIRIPILLEITPVRKKFEWFILTGEREAFLKVNIFSSLYE